MPKGDKNSYTGKQPQKAEPIGDSYRKGGVGEQEAEERAWRTANKQDGGAKKKPGGPLSRGAQSRVGATVKKANALSKRPARTNRTRARAGVKR